MRNAGIIVIGNKVGAFNTLSLLSNYNSRLQRRKLELRVAVSDGPQEKAGAAPAFPEALAALKGR